MTPLNSIWYLSTPDNLNKKVYDFSKFFNDYYSTDNDTYIVETTLHNPNGYSVELILPPINSAYDLYVNDMHVFSSGKVGNRDYEIPLTSRRVVYLDPTNKEYAIKLLVSNHVDRHLGFTDYVLIGHRDSIFRYLYLSYMLFFFSQGLLFFACLFYFAHWLSYRKRISSLIIFIAALNLFIRQIFADRIIPPLVSVLPSWYEELSTKITYICAVWVLILLGAFINSIYTERRSIIFTFQLYVGALYTPLMILYPAEIFTKSLFFLQILIILQAVFLLSDLIKRVYLKLPNSIILLVAYFVDLSTVVNDTLYSNKVIMTANLSGYGLEFVLFAQVLTVAKIYEGAFQKSLYLTDNLKKEVKAQTAILREQNETIKKQEEQKTNMFINIAHETKTPLTIILNLVASIRSRYKDDTEITILDKNVKKLLRDMMNFLDVEKLSMGMDLYSHEHTSNVTYLTKKACSHFTDIGRISNTKIEAFIDNKAYVDIDPDAYNRVIYNLLNNAQKYCDSSVPITVKLTLTDTLSILEVINASRHDLSKITAKDVFLPFKQLSSSKNNAQGVGLGMFIVDSIVREYGGNCVLTTENNIFHVIISWPRSANDFGVYDDYFMQFLYSDDVSVDEYVATIVDNRKNILIVEDNKELQYFMSQELNSLFNIYSAYDGVEALNLLSDSSVRYDLVITDIMMNRMDGVEFIRRVREKEIYNSLPIVVASARSMEEDKHQLLNMGAIDYISKPFSISELKIKLLSILNLIDSDRETIKKDIRNRIDSYFNESPNSRVIRIPQDWGLSDKEKEIVTELCNGMQDKEIAAKLDSAVSTIRNQIQSIYNKSGIRRRIDLINHLNS